jgi:hypothetical protein
VSDRIQVVAVGVSLLLLVAVLELVRRRRLAEDYSFFWILGSLALIALSMRRELLYSAADLLGVHYPPVVLLMILVVLVFVGGLSFTVIVSRQREQIDRLIEETAILSAELRELRRDATPSTRVSRAEAPVDHTG